MKRVFLLLSLLLLPSVQASSGALTAFLAMLEAEEDLQLVGQVQEAVLFPPREPTTSVVAGFNHPSFIGQELVERNFIFSLSEGEAVAGRSAWHLTLSPRDGISPHWSFWLDQDSKLRLAYEQRDARGRLLAEGRFTRVDRLTNRQEPYSLRHSEEAMARLQGNLRRFPNALVWPQAYTPLTVERTRLAGRFALRFVAWDGLNSLMLIAYPGRVAEPPQGDYLSSGTVGRVTLSLLGPLAPEHLERLLMQAAAGPLRHFEERQIRGWDTP